MVSDPCIDATLTINPLILPSLVIDYEVGSFIKSIQFDENFIRSSVPNCPEYNFKFVSLKEEENELDPDVFAQYTQMLKIYTKSYDKIGLYPVQLVITFESTFNYPSIANLNFLVKITDDKNGLNGGALLITRKTINSQGLLTIEFN